ncbi:mitogen-activated protein kinase kinase kinase 5-like isoform X1 [Zingiber officinale]|uniref:mitogen-activated protein kinase kinase kinase 5-like isoform X1 n=1 Tax=Zingiber officinale TaxID=94328 RepID=UPI001C4A8568|nr:mitogen-activated protein kinase kinase kinase 5-like isoform X1 [Zingiber officinale]
MRWWNRKSAGSPSSSSSSPSSATSSPGSARSRSKDLHFWTRRGDSQRRLTRLSELDRLAEIDLGGRSFDSSNADPRSGSLPTASRSSLGNLDSNPGRTVSALVLLPRPLPLPESATPAAASPRRDPTQVPASGFGFPSPNSACCRLPSPIELTKRLEGNEGTRVGTEVSSVMEPLRDRTFPAGEIGSRLPHQISSRNSEPTGISRNGFAFRRQKKLSQDPNYNGTAAFRLNIPAKSAPTSGFSSPVHSPLYSPRRLSNVDFSTFNIATPGRQVWPSLEIPFNESLPAFSQKIIPSPDHSPLRSPTVRSPDPRPWNLSAPSSPLNTRMLSDNFAASHENGSNVNGHPLPLPPGAISPSHSGSSHQNGVKSEALKSQWKKGKLIGSGTFGNVYEATNRHTGALCAMKEVNIIPGDAKSAECITQLEQEIKFLSQFEHPNIVQYYGSETIDDQFYIYLEYVHPGSINKYVRQHCGAVTESVVRNFTGHILKGLAYLHSKNIMHRDIKGANLLVDVHGVVKLADFGMAKHLSGAAGALSLKGSPYWMAPEVMQATLNKDIGYDLAVDIWSLGCTIIEMFTGKQPWNGLEGAAAMFKVLHKDPPIPESLSNEGKDFLRSCFRRNPAERPTALMLLEHPFIRFFHYNYNILGNPEGIPGSKAIENTASPREKSKSRSELCVKGKNSCNGENCHSHLETFETATFPVPQSASEISRSMPSPQQIHLRLSSASDPVNTLNGVPLDTGNFQLYALPKSHEQVH